MKVMTILGTRPEIIRLSLVMARIESSPVIDHVLVHTGQNYDYELNEIFFEELDVRRPDHFLEVDTSSLGATYGDVLRKSEIVLRHEQPDAVLILGDTNSAIAAIMAKRLHVPVIHMEAGNRCFDWRVPEETNRHIVDCIADINLVYTEHARRNLLAEGIPSKSIFLSGSPMREVLDHYRPGIEASPVLRDLGLEPGGFFLASLHREESVDNVESLGQLLSALRRLSEQHGLPTVLSVHPRTRDRLSRGGFAIDDDRYLRFEKPFGFLAYNKLQMNARCVISDSGTIAEESAILGFPAVSPRTSTERPEGVDSGTVIVAGTNPDDIVAAVVQAASGVDVDPVISPDYCIPDTSNRVLSVLLSRPLHGGGPR